MLHPNNGCNKLTIGFTFFILQEIPIQVDERHFNRDAQKESKHVSYHQNSQIGHCHIHFRVVEWDSRQAYVIYSDA